MRTRLRGEAEAKRALASEERERKMWRVDGRIQEERMKHEDELRIVRQSSRKDIDELQTQMAGILIGHAKQKDVLQEKNLTLQKALEEMANEPGRSQERCAGTQDELDRCKRTLQEAEEESARCRENAAKLDAQRAEMEGLIREQNKREHALVEERDATSHRVVQLQRMRGLLCNPCKGKDLHRDSPDPPIKAAVSVEDSDGPRAGSSVKESRVVLEDGHGEAYACLDSRGLFEAVRDMMVDWARRLPAEEKRCRPQVVGGTGRKRLGPLPRDRAGLKHVLLIYGTTPHYLPNEELRNRRKKRTVIPVVTQYSEKHNLVRYDARRSMVGTYSVVIPRSENDSRRSYFVQEVLFAPGVKSLKLLREIAGTMFDFLGHDPGDAHARSPGGHEQSEHDTLASHLEEIQPMCCVPEPPDGPGAIRIRNARPARLFRESQVKCDLTRFEYDKGLREARLVYFRRSSKVLDGKRNLLPAASPRKDQENMRELYASTTLGFYRAPKRSCVKGNGELMSCWNETSRTWVETRSSPGGNVPRHTAVRADGAHQALRTRRAVQRLAETRGEQDFNPTMIEVAELAIAMEGRIPSALPCGRAPLLPHREYATISGSDADTPTRVSRVVQNKRPVSYPPDEGRSHVPG
ncbi:hypothetical protein Q5P01_000991 [Channa striata]|uniref:Uncharacterized protein n=1 Tax=Channa striata TaxID=64152 RepID=A0AA88IGV8_CHASR|nr:hypothetical protein Q5P01_000991 [Channa striata]